ncbi:hypothetical protein J6E39_08890 [bacterium]|nr:hypothetical protein [bacterium]
MTIIELYAKNNYHLKEEWELSTNVDYNKISSILNSSQKENFVHSNTLFHEAVRAEAISEHSRLKQILNDMEKIIIPNVILSQKSQIYKTTHGKDIYLLDDNFAYILFSYDEKTQNIKVFDIITSIIFSIRD